MYIISGALVIIMGYGIIINIFLAPVSTIFEMKNEYDMLSSREKNRTFSNIGLFEKFFRVEYGIQWKMGILRVFAL